MSNYRDYLYPTDHPRLTMIAGCENACAYGDAMLASPELGDFIKQWTSQYENEVFHGITSDGTRIPDLYPIGGEENAPTAAATAAARALLGALGPEARTRLQHPVDSKVWRAWMNPEFYVNRFGLRLEDLDSSTGELALNLVRASVSPEGFKLIRNLMRVNGFLGELTGLPVILNEYSYNINIFGDPSTDWPWGWNLYGHHVCVNCLFVAGQQILTPTFLGAEPNEIDAGEYAGVTVLADREIAGLEFMSSLPSELAERATLFPLKRDPAMPEDRLHPGDELHLGGAFQDNRIVPYEGIRLIECSADQREAVVELIERFLSLYPEGPRAARLAAVRSHLDDTWFCWIGGTNADEPFYYRLQSPVIMVEFDHHAGIFLSNTEPQRFHIHTVVRTPNGNDYGAAYMAQTTGALPLLDGAV